MPRSHRLTLSDVLSIHFSHSPLQRNPSNASAVTSGSGLDRGSTVFFFCPCDFARRDHIVKEFHGKWPNRRLNATNRET
jgi:hypothetical protein